MYGFVCILGYPLRRGLYKLDYWIQGYEPNTFHTDYLIYIAKNNVGKHQFLWHLPRSYSALLFFLNLMRK